MTKILIIFLTKNNEIFIRNMQRVRYTAFAYLDNQALSLAVLWPSTQAPVPPYLLSQTVLDLSLSVTDYKGNQRLPTSHLIFQDVAYC